MLDLNTLNKQQLEAVTHGDGAMLVCAGPGSGKTKVITTRISYLIEHLKVDPQHILVLTFTKQAALSMQERFLQSNSSHSKQSYLPVQFGTFHAIFYQIMKQSSDMRAEAMLTNSEKRQLLLPILTDLKRNNDSMEPYQDASQILGAINLYKNTGNLEKVSHSLEEPYQSLFPQILRSYENARKRTNKYDFDDMVYQCYQLLKSNKQLLHRWQNQFRHILVDEFQDINPMQYKVLQLLTLHNANIFVVGDDDQAIYGFRGSSPFLMQQFQRDYPEVKQVLLNTNYRSSKEIVTMSLKVIDENKTRIVKDLKAYKEVSILQEEGTKLLGFPTKDNQYQHLISRLKEEQQNKLKDCAVLFRTNAQMQSFANTLVKEGIPYSMKEKPSCIYDHFIAKDIYHYIQFASGRYERNLFLHIMNKPLRGISRISLLEEKIDFPEIIKYYQTYVPVKEATSMIMVIKRLERELNQLKAMKPYLGVTFLRKRIGYERYLKEKAGNRPEILLEWLDLLEWITADAKKYSTYDDWFIAQEYVRQQMQYTPSKEQNDKKEGVRLMTVHMSKGLEFKKVFIPDINQGIYPYGKMQEMEVIEEERRILYVAMTRAKEVLEMLYVTGNKEHPRTPSQFLNPLL